MSQAHVIEVSCRAVLAAGRGLNLLATLGVIQLRGGAGTPPTPSNITANPQDLRIGSEAVDGNPYRNVIAVRAGSAGDPRLRTLVDAYHSDAVRPFILSTYQGRQLPA